MEVNPTDTNKQEKGQEMGVKMMAIRTIPIRSIFIFKDNLCSTDTSIMEPCRVRNMSDTRVGYPCRVCF